MRVWQVDSMVQVFENRVAPKEDVPIVIDAARNETVSAQFAVRAAKDLDGLRCTVSPLVAGRSRLARVQVRYVGFVPVRKNSHARAIRKAPGRFPDPLLEDQKTDVPTGRTQPVWITIRVPKDAAPGDHKGKVVFAVGGDRAELPLTVRVYKAVLPDERTLWVTNWTAARSRKRMELVVDFPWIPTEERYWRLLRAYAENMAAHRQNVILTPVYDLTQARARQDGKLSFDFRLFDRWVKLFTDAGVIGRIEGSHLAGGKYGTTNHKSTIWVVRDGRAERRRVGSFAKGHKAFLALFLPALQQHLERKGWLDIYLQHIFDEPTPKNTAQYKALAETVRQAAPRLRIVEATHSHALAGSVDVWVPQLDHLSKRAAFYAERREAGDEVWFYTCCGPRDGRHLNRFLDYPLLQTRLLHWANARLGATGYLHWGWNQWTRKDPFSDVESHGSQWLPPGDKYIVYPKAGGVLDSIRSEAMLEGLQDYELLKVLSARNPAAAQKALSAVCRSATDYVRDVAAFRAARREMLETLSGE